MPDVVALAATVSNDGVVSIPGASGTGVFAVATVNVGGGGTITATKNGGKTIIADASGHKATVTQGDDQFTNGVVHHIDALLMPSNGIPELVARSIHE